MTNINDASLANLKHYEGKWKHGQTRTIRVPIVLTDAILEYTRQLDQGIEHCNINKNIMIKSELIDQLQTAMSLLTEVLQELNQSQIELPFDGKFAKSPSTKNDPLEFYVNHCTLKQGSEMGGTELFYVYKQWCNNNGSLSRGRRFFLDAIAQLGAPDGITGVIRGKSYTFRNLALKTG